MYHMFGQFASTTFSSSTKLRSGAGTPFGPNGSLMDGGRLPAMPFWSIRRFVLRLRSFPIVGGLR
eukprot:scaffold1534_cov267-Pinguiococcus_pyrenoidosus.AAC.1